MRVYFTDAAGVNALLKGGEFFPLDDMTDAAWRQLESAGSAADGLAYAVRRAAAGEGVVLPIPAVLLMVAVAE